MSRYLKFAILTVLIVGLMAGSALAGTTWVNNGAANTATSISWETLGGARNIVMNGASNIVQNAGANSVITYTLTQELAITNLVKMTFVGAAFTGNQYVVCHGGSNGLTVATGTPTAGSNSFNFQAATNVPVGSVLFFNTSAVLGNGCNNTLAGGPSNFPVQISATTGTTAATVTIEVITSGGITVDQASTKNLALIRKEYVGYVSNTAHVIDFLGSPGGGVGFTTASSVQANDNGAGNLITDGALTNNFRVDWVANDWSTVGAVNFGGLSVGGTLQVTDSQAWQGVDRVFIVNTDAAFAGACNTSDRKSVV